MRNGFKFILITLLTLLVLGSGILLYVYMNIGQLKKYALQEVNVMLKAELSASQIDVSVFKTFPNVSLTLQDVSLKDPIRRNKKLFSARNLYLGFNVYDVLQKRYKIQMLVLDSGQLHLAVLPDGRNNWDVLKETNDRNTANEKKQPMQFHLNKFILNNIQLTYADAVGKTQAHLLIHEGIFSGSFTESKYTMSVNVKTLVNTLQSGSFTMLKEKEVELITDLQVNKDKEEIAIYKCSLLVNKLMLNCKGALQKWSGNPVYDFQFQSAKAGIQELLSTLPVTLPAVIYEYKSDGKVYFAGTVKGKGTKPLIRIDFGIEQGTLTEPKTSLRLDHIDLKGTFSNGNLGTMKEARIEIPVFNAQIESSHISGKLEMTDMENPALFLDINGRANLETLHRFFKFEDVKNIQGDLAFSLTLKGQSQNNEWNWANPMNKGLFQLNMPVLELNFLTQAIADVKLKADLTHAGLSFAEANLKIGESDFGFTADFPSFLDYISGKEKMFRGKMNCRNQNLNMNNLLIYDSSDPRESNEEPLQYEVSMKVNAQHFKYDLFDATDFQGNFILTPDKISFDQVKFNTCSGQVNAGGEYLMLPDKYILKGSTQAKNIQITALLKQFNNFSQNEFTDKNLSGSLTTNTEILIMWDNKFELLEDKMVVLSEMTLKNGELKNYEPLNSLSTFVDVNELQNLRFSELKNTLTIKNKALYIPAMDIKNNALNLSLTGTHTFSNVLDYHVKLSLSELLKKKRKPKANEFGEEDEKTKGINLYLTISGPIDKLKYTFDRKEAKAQLKQDFKQEKEAVKDILKQEFGIKKDTSLKQIEKKNNNDEELEFEPN